jgi:2-succinyl-5-enolpyruvyl-6-hydroxy-3-cyclohexene-1-carboxylate synthase
VTSTHQAQVIVKSLIKHGVQHVVIAPGSRNAPLSIALSQAKEFINVYVRFDERTAAFTALGMARRLNKPVAVLCTSGTAATHFQAAAFEAHESGVPLILITADRPAEVRGLGANQTIEQPGLYANAVRGEWDVDSSKDDTYLELVVAGAISCSLGEEFISAGPVHLNVPFSEPLVGEKLETDWLENLETGVLPVGPEPEKLTVGEIASEMGITNSNPKGLIIISDPNSAATAVALANLLQWPVFAEPGSFARHEDVAIAHYAKILGDEEFVNANQPDIVFTAGRFGLSRKVNSFVRNAKAHIAIGRYPLDADSFETAAHHVAVMPLPIGVDAAPADWLQSWKDEDKKYETKVEYTQAGVIQALYEKSSNKDLIWLAPSLSIRCADDVFTPRNNAPMVLVNRGTNGIDGLIASASGASLVHGGENSYLIIGDVAFLHDVSSLALPELELRPNLRIVVINNRGGRIFETLEQGAPAFKEVFPRVFSTVHNQNIAAIADSFGWKAKDVSNLDEFETAFNSDAQVIVVNL